MKLDAKKLLGLRVLAAESEANQGAGSQDGKKIGAKIGDKAGLKPT